MTKKELLKALEIQKKVLKETQTHLDNIEQEIKKLDDNGFEPTPKWWKPNEGEVFWVADLELNTVVYNNIKQFKSRNSRIFKYNRIFKTLEECQLYCGIQRAFRNASRDFDINKANYFLFYSYSGDAIEYSCQNRTKRNNLYFDSEETIQNLVNKFGEENVKRYYFGVY